VPKVDLFDDERDGFEEFFMSVWIFLAEDDLSPFVADDIFG
jgi:hypothetical protein